MSSKIYFVQDGKSYEGHAFLFVSKLSFLIILTFNTIKITPLRERHLINQVRSRGQYNSTELDPRCENESQSAG